MTEDDNSKIWQEMRVQRDILVELRTLMTGHHEFRAETKIRLDRLEERRFPWPTIAGIVSVIALVIAAISASPSIGK